MFFFRGATISHHPGRLRLALTLLRVVYRLLHHVFELLQGGLDQVPALRRLLLQDLEFVRHPAEVRASGSSFALDTVDRDNTALRENAKDHP